MKFFLKKTREVLASIKLSLTMLIGFIVMAFSPKLTSYLFQKNDNNGENSCDCNKNKIIDSFTSVILMLLVIIFFIIVISVLFITMLFIPRNKKPPLIYLSGPDKYISWDTLAAYSISKSKASEECPDDYVLISNYNSDYREGYHFKNKYKGTAWYFLIKSDLIRNLQSIDINYDIESSAGDFFKTAQIWAVLFCVKIF